MGHYKEILQTAKSSGYKFLLFNQGRTGISDKQCLLRHDIDYTPEKSKEFGRIEADLGIQSTYFFQVVAWTYNVREKVCYKTIRELHDMGHQIALHFDASWEEARLMDMPALCKNERALLATLTSLDIPDIVSFHNPGVHRDKVLNKEVAGIHHTYEPRYFSEFKYLSDSQGWYEGCVCKLFERGNYPRIQLLTHPYIWSKNPRSNFTEDVASLIKVRRDQLTEYMISYHPVCKKNASRLRRLVKKEC